MSTDRRPQLSWLVVVLLLWAPLGSAATTLAVEVTGIDGELLDNVRAALSIVARANEPDLDEARVRTLHAQADREIRRALEPFGHYQATIRDKLEREGNDWRASYQVDPGPAVTLTRVDAQLHGAGAEAPALRQALAELPLAEGQTLDHRTYETARSHLLQTAFDAGFLAAAFSSHRIEVDLADNSARITLKLDTGPLYTVGEIRFAQERFAPEFLARYLLLEPGEPFTRERISAQRTALSRSGFFREVTIEEGDTSAAQGWAIPLTIALEPFLANRYRGRLGWGTDTGFGIQLDWTRRYLGRHGHSLSAGVTAVEERERLAGDAIYTIPLEPLARSNLELALRHESKNLSFEDVDLDEGGETRINTNLGAVSWRRPERELGSFRLETILSLGFTTEDYDVFEVLFGNLPDSAQQAIIDAIGPVAFSTLSPEFEALTAEARLILSRADDPLYIRRGDYFDLRLTGADENLGSNISFWQAQLMTWNIWPVGDRHRLLLRTNLGYSDADSREALGVTFNQMPEYYEFRAGGARSVRGYGFEQIFPVDGITGARNQVVASIEYEHEIIPDWSAAVFLDAGDAFNDVDDFDEKLGTGIGVRWRSPVGLARIDLGFPLDDADDSWQLYITVGPEF